MVVLAKPYLKEEPLIPDFEQNPICKSLSTEIVDRHLLLAFRFFS